MSETASARARPPWRRRGSRGAGLAAIAAGLVAGCGSSSELPPPAEPATSPPVATAPAGRVVQVGHMPEGLAVDPATGLVAVGLRDPDRLAIVDGRSGRVTARARLPAAPRHLQLARRGGPVLVPAEGADALVEVSLPGGRVTTRSDVGDFPHDAAAVGARRFVANEFADTISVVEGARAVETVDAPVQPGGIAALGRDLVGVVAVRGNVLRTYDPDTLEVVSETDAGAGPTHIAADPPGERFYVADTRGEALLSTTFAERPEILDRLNLPGAPYGLALDPRRRRAWITLPATNELAEIELEGNEPSLVRTFPTVGQPNTVAVDVSTGAVFVAGRADGELQILGTRGR